MFEDSHFNKEGRYSLGLHTKSGKYYVSIPVSNHLADYEEYYEITKELHDGYPENRAAIESFVAACRARKKDDLLIIKPGRDRGFPC